jgi:cytochrome P450
MARSHKESIHQVPPWREDLSDFKPERWLKLAKDADGKKEEGFDRQAGPNLAFSAGPRQCFGKKLAYMKLRAVIRLLICVELYDQLA